MIYSIDETYKIWTMVDRDLRNKLIVRAKVDEAFVDDKGKVDIGAVLHLLVDTYANGDYTILYKKS